MSKTTEAKEYEEFVRRVQRTEHGAIQKKYPDDGSELIAGLNRAARDNELVLVLGAGVSIPSGLPDWDEVTEKLIDAVLQQKGERGLARRIARIDLPPYRRTRIIESLNPGFRLTIRDVLYGRRERPNPTLDAIARLVNRAVQARKHLSIITYNFDDLLERTLDSHGLTGRYRIIDSAASFDQNLKSPARIAIFHPHGFVPKDGDLEQLLGAMLVFSERQYHRSYFATEHWTGQLQRNCFASSACLFLGCSFNDQDQRRLLDQTEDDGKRRLVAIMRRSDKFKSAKTNGLTDYVIQHDLSLLNVKPLWITKWSELPVTLNQLLH
jgi:hypothetical protein